VPFKCNEPAIATVQKDDSSVRITRWDFAPGAATGWHSHGWPYFVVLLTDAVMKIERDGEVSEARFTAGDSYQRPSGVEHDVLNASDRPMAFVEIEIKRPADLV
jgi:quercetin dioxygenase-like cupin family protein